MSLISPLFDIVSLIERYGNIRTVGSAIVHGIREVHSNCPWCPGSEDSFIMRPETGRYSHAIRPGGCKRSGDCLDFLMEYANIPRHQALEILGLENLAWSRPGPKASLSNARERPPGREWQATGMTLVEYAERYLWTPAGAPMRDYLHSRGLKDEIIKKKRLGYIPLCKDGSYYQSPFEDWGLDPATLTEEQRKKGGVRVPNGIMIPWLAEGVLWKLAIKRPSEKVSYGQVMGSGEGLYNADAICYDEPCMMVEAEFCAMAVEQESGLACVATGSSARARTNRWIGELNLPSFVLQSFDEDEAGDEAAIYWHGGDAVPAAIKHCLRWSPRVAKDPNDILTGKFLPGYESCCTLAEWVTFGLESGKREFEGKTQIIVTDPHREVFVSLTPEAETSEVMPVAVPRTFDTPPLVKESNRCKRRESLEEVRMALAYNFYKCLEHKRSRFFLDENRVHHIINSNDITKLKKGIAEVRGVLQQLGIIVIDLQEQY